MTRVRNEHLVVIPAFNEAATVASVVCAVRTKAPWCDVIVVNDGSRDATTAEARSAGADVLEMPFNLGIGGAVQAGFVFAKENGYRWMIQVDGDGQHEPAEIATLQAVMAEDPTVDVVCGSRFLEPGQYLPPISRRTGIHVFAFLLSRIVRQTITDPTSGFRLYNRRAIELFSADYPHDYPEVEAVLMLHNHRLRMLEVPVRMFNRGGGQSSISSGKSAYYMIKVLLALFVGLLRRRAVPGPTDAAHVPAEHAI
ncbi:glycosyltransferase family 2 protein [Solirubrobacter soli]|uniref:glycosyltransferase family 2 protein n=1 Tax=Solirubrobacter soli TaxID=363832 RepID=UPI0004146CD8|nr:glycosyltransferase family 2 protein [Solirubrobacter soli]